MVQLNCPEDSEDKDERAWWDCNRASTSLGTFIFPTPTCRPDLCFALYLSEQLLGRQVPHCRPSRAKLQGRKTNSFNYGNIKDLEAICSGKIPRQVQAVRASRDAACTAPWPYLRAYPGDYCPVNASREA